MNIVYILGKGSNWKDAELRYSLRSVQQHISGRYKIYIVGFKPDWVKNVIHIPAEDKYNDKERNIHHKLQVACKEIKTPFLWMHDDHFINEDCTLKSFADLYKNGTIEERIRNTRTKNSYLVSLHNTQKALNFKKHGTWYFDIHIPIVIVPEMFTTVMGWYDWTIKKGYCIKSLYLNSLGKDGTEIKDAKIYEAGDKEFFRERTKGMKVFSIHDQAICPGLDAFMKETYPEPSKYEV